VGAGVGASVGAAAQHIQKGGQLNTQMHGRKHRKVTRLTEANGCKSAAVHPDGRCACATAYDASAVSD
jgi:hypothetical protein